MRPDSEFVLLGTGLAPLVTAAELLAAGRRVVLINPEPDFFAEDSEFPLDPLVAADVVSDPAAALRRLVRSSPERALSVLRPGFPGAVESWPTEPHATGAGGLRRDPTAPHVRARSRLWLRPARAVDWPSFEDFYLSSLDAGLKPQLAEGLAAVRRFPGASGRSGLGAQTEARGLLVPRLADVDVNRYRYGLLEFVRERLGPEGLLCGATQIGFIPDGVRFHFEGRARTVQIRDSALVFWTPRLTTWVLGQAKRFEVPQLLPPGIRFWDQWTLRSREALDPATVGVFEEMTVWGELEGAPDAAGTDLLTVLRPGGGVAPGSWSQGLLAPPIASGESIQSLSRICGDLLAWNGFSVRAHRARMVFDWESWSSQGPQDRILSEASPRIELLGGADGALVDVVERARQVAGRLA